MAKKNKKQYVVKPGDSPAKIAREMYGDERMFYELIKANGGVTNLKAGMVLNLPRKVKKPFIPNSIAKAVGMSTSTEYAAWYNAGGQGQMPVGAAPAARPVAETGRYGQSGMTVRGGAEAPGSPSTAAAGGLGGPAGMNTKAPRGYGPNAAPPAGAPQAGGNQNAAGQFTGMGMQSYTAPAQPSTNVPVGVAVEGAAPTRHTSYTGPQPTRRPPNSGMGTNSPSGATATTVGQTPSAGVANMLNMNKKAQDAQQRAEQARAAAARAQNAARAKAEVAQLPPGSTTYEGTNLPNTPTTVRASLESGKFPYVVSGQNIVAAYPGLTVPELAGMMAQAGYTYNSYGGYFYHTGQAQQTSGSAPGSISTNTPNYLPIIGGIPELMSSGGGGGGGSSVPRQVTLSGVINADMDWRVATG